MARLFSLSRNERHPFFDGVLSYFEIQKGMKTILDSELFDEQWYRKVSKRPAGGDKALVSHYLLHGFKEGLNPNQLFDGAWYADRYQAEVGDQNPLLHYLHEGWRRRYDPHPLFSVDFYLAQNEDVREAGCEPLAHFFKFGAREGRSPCQEFDSPYYIKENADVAAQGVNPLCHYIEYGADEGRKPSAWFDTAWYRRTVLKGSRINPLVHMRAQGSSDFGFTKISMGVDYTISDAEYRLWVRACASLCNGPAKQDPTDRLVVVRARPDAAEPLARGGLSETTLSRLLADHSAQRMGPHLYLFCADADEIETSLLDSLLASIGSTNALATFDFVAASGQRWTPVLLPGANPAHVKAVDATFSRFIISGELLSQLTLTDDISPYGILRAAIEHLHDTDSLSMFVHVPIPVLRARVPVASIRTTRIELNGKGHLVDQMERGARLGKGVGNSVSVVICTKDRCHLLSQLLDNLLRLDRTMIRDVVVVTNAEADSYASKVHAHYATMKRVTFLRHEGPYNFSTACNRGAASGSGELILFLNDDIVPIGGSWLEQLRLPFTTSPKVGITGPLLLYPDERTQHAGMYLGFNGCAGHTLRGSRLPEDDYLFTATAARNVSAVTGAALLTDRGLFESLNGFDRQLGTYLQDVDYCLRVRNLDRDIIYQPTSRLFHMESVSMRETEGASVFADRRPLEHRHFTRKWRDALTIDEFRNPNLDIEDETQRTIVRRVA